MKKFKKFVLENSNYMLGNVKYSWIKKIIKNIYYVEPVGTTRIDILVERKKELILNEFQTLYEYWNFCDKNSGNFKIANNPVENYKSWISKWVWYLVMIQLFPNELKNTIENRDFFTKPYNEIISLPKLTGELEDDKIILEKAILEYFCKPNSPTRQLINIFYIHFENMF